jgi:hypothetical protein
MRRFLVVVLICSAIRGADSEAVGQVSPSSSGERCANAARALAQGARDGSGWEHLPDCGSTGAKALAQAFGEARAESDVDYLGNLYTAMASVRDPAVFSMALEVMQDQTAGERARATAILIAVAQHTRRIGLSLDFLYQEAMTSSDAERCRLVPIRGATKYRSDAPLPGDYLQQFGSAVENVIHSPASPALVRGFAGCARRALSGAFAATVPSSAIRFSHVCGNRFLIRNTSAYWVTVSWDVSGTGIKRDLSVPPTGEKVFTADRQGQTRLHHRGSVIHTVENDGKTRCSA